MNERGKVRAPSPNHPSRLGHGKDRAVEFGRVEFVSAGENPQINPNPPDRIGDAPLNASDGFLCDGYGQRLPPKVIPSESRPGTSLFLGTRKTRSLTSTPFATCDYISGPWAHQSITPGDDEGPLILQGP